MMASSNGSEPQARKVFLLAENLRTCRGTYMSWKFHVKATQDSFAFQAPPVSGTFIQEPVADILLLFSVFFLKLFSALTLRGAKNLPLPPIQRDLC